MRTEEPRPIRLTDYRPPPDWLIETVELDVSLDPTATRVRAKLKIKPNSASAPAPLVLDGDELNLISLALDGKPLPAESFVASLDKLTIAPTGPARPACNVLVATGSESRSDEAVGTKIITDASHAIAQLPPKSKGELNKGVVGIVGQGQFDPEDLLRSPKISAILSQIGPRRLADKNPVTSSSRTARGQAPADNRSVGSHAGMTADLVSPGSGDCAYARRYR
jgi:hypothetical protein